MRRRPSVHAPAAPGISLEFHVEPAGRRTPADARSPRDPAIVELNGVMNSPSTGNFDGRRIALRATVGWRAQEHQLESRTAFAVAPGSEWRQVSEGHACEVAWQWPRVDRLVPWSGPAEPTRCLSAR